MADHKYTIDSLSNPQISQLEALLRCAELLGADDQEHHLIPEPARQILRGSVLAGLAELAVAVAPDADTKEMLASNKFNLKQI